MRKRIIILEFSLLIPYFVTIFNPRFCVDVINGILTFLGFNISESHLTIGAWLLVAYIFLLPLIQLLLFLFPKVIIRLSMFDKTVLWLTTFISSVCAWYMYSENIVLIT